MHSDTHTNTHTQTHIGNYLNDLYAAVQQQLDMIEKSKNIGAAQSHKVGSAGILKKK